mgnify:CR=1 FL=1
MNQQRERGERHVHRVLHMIGKQAGDPAWRNAANRDQLPNAEPRLDHPRCTGGKQEQLNARSRIGKRHDRCEKQQVLDESQIESPVAEPRRERCVRHEQREHDPGGARSGSTHPTATATIDERECERGDRGKQREADERRDLQVEHPVAEAVEDDVRRERETQRRDTSSRLGRARGHAPVFLGRAVCVGARGHVLNNLRSIRIGG